MTDETQQPTTEETTQPVGGSVTDATVEDGSSEAGTLQDAPSATEPGVTDESTPVTE